MLMIVLALSKYLLYQDSPDDADASSVPLEKGDVIVLATDGLWDNMDDQAIWQEIEANLQVGT